MRCAILSAVAGVALLETSAALPTRATALCCALAWLACALWVARARRGRWFALCAGGAVTGFAWAALVAHLALADALAPAAEGRELTVVGTVDSLPYVFPGGVRFNFAVERVEGAAVHVPRHVALAWYAGLRGARQTVGAVAPGERWRLRVRLQRPHGNANPYGFDYEQWLLEQGLRATGYVRAADENARLAQFVPGAGNAVERTRAWLRARILAALPDAPYAGVIVALVIGDQRAISQSDWVVFNRTGISHLVSISGLHITMVAGLFAWVAGALWRHSFFTAARLPLRIPAQKVAALAGACTALLYVLLAGFGVPAQRTLYMLGVVAVAIWTGRAASFAHVLALALGTVVLLDPWAVLAPGFWLSFGAVAAILYAGSGRVRQDAPGWRAALRGAARAQLAVTLGLVPLTMLLFARVSLASPLANAVAIPLVSFIVTPLALIGSLAPPGISVALLYLAHACIAGLAWLLQLLAQAPWAVWPAPVPGALAFISALAGTAWMLAPPGWPVRWAGAAACLPLLGAVAEYAPPGHLRVTAFDVGQGMALLIETSGHRLLYDTGPAYGSASDAGERVLLPYLRARGIARLDGLVVSHGDADHAGGALTLLREVDAGWVLSSLDERNAIVRAAARPIRCAAGQRWTWDGVDFEVLHPTAASYADATLSSNARGCVLRVRAGSHALLLAADIEAPQEAALVAAGAPLGADVLLAPHHGSGTSSTEPFLAAVHPSIALFQVGWRNRYHHPKPQVYARYGARGIARLRTDTAGAITVDFGAAIDVQAYRQAHARYWYGR